MPTYRVAFDGKWQETFDDLEGALRWGQEVGDTGRLVYVAKRRWLRGWRLVAVFPEDRAGEGLHLWERQGMYAGSGASV